MFVVKLQNGLKQKKNEELNVFGATLEFDMLFKR